MFASYMYVHYMQNICGLNNLQYVGGLALQCFYNYNATEKKSGSTSSLLAVIGGASGSGLTLLLVVISVALVMHFRRKKNRKQINHSCM